MFNKKPIDKWFNLSLDQLFDVDMTLMYAMIFKD